MDEVSMVLAVMARSYIHYIGFLLKEETGAGENESEEDEDEDEDADEDVDEDANENMSVADGREVLQGYLDCCPPRPARL